LALAPTIYVRALLTLARRYFWEVGVEIEAEEKTGGEEAGAMIQNFFNDESTISQSQATGSLDALLDGGGSVASGTQESESVITATTGAALSLTSGKSEANPTPTYPAISILTAILHNRLTNKCWGNATSAAAALAQLCLRSPHWSDRNPSLCPTPHEHLAVQETGTLSYEIAQAIVASGGDTALAYGLSLLQGGQGVGEGGGGDSDREALLSATGPDGTTTLQQMLTLMGRLTLSHEDLRDSIGNAIVKDKTQAASVPGSRAGGSRSSKHSRQSSRHPATPLPTPATLESAFKVMIESMINGVRVFTGQGMDGMNLTHSSSEVNFCDLNIKIEACCAIGSLCEGHGGGVVSFAEVGMPALRALVTHAQKQNPPELQAQACRCMYVAYA
jgi:hypothetical protein